jgi:putative flippase GtrA
MRDYVERLLELYNTPSGKRMFRYTMVSIISTSISFAVLIIIYGVLKLWTQVPSTLISNLTGVLPSYYLNRNWAWGKAGKSHVTREVLPFWIASVLGILASVAAAAEARHISIAHHLHHLSSTLLVVGANVLAFSVLWVFKFIVFNRLFHVTPEAEAELELKASSPESS